MRRPFLALMMLAMLLAPVMATAQPVPDRPTPQRTPQPQPAPPDQQPPPAQPPSQTPKPEPARPPVPAMLMLKGQPVNVKVELTITDQYGSAAPVQKTVSLLVADRQSGMIRSEGVLPGFGSVQLHVDADVSILPAPESKILTQIGLNYDLVDPKASSTERQSQKTQIRESLRTILENAKPMVISQSADPVTDRKVTVEVKATIIR
jgi:hypothetical protein